MEFITVEQFKEQPKEIQKIFLEWWKASVGDLFTWIDQDKHDMSELGCCCSELQAEITDKSLDNRIPLFTEGQLRKFIEDKAKCKVMVEYTSCENIVIKICTQDEVTGALRYNRKSTFSNNKFDLINSYWKVACMIAKEEVDG